MTTPARLPGVLAPGTRLLELREPLREPATLITIGRRRTLLPQSLFGTERPADGTDVYALSGGRWFLASHVDWAIWRAQRG